MYFIIAYFRFFSSSFRRKCYHGKRRRHRCVRVFCINTRVSRNIAHASEGQSYSHVNAHSGLLFQIAFSNQVDGAFFGFQIGFAQVLAQNAHTEQLNTAYQLVETVAPSGYVLMEEPCYFWVRSNSSATAPALKPDGFAGSAISSGGVLNIFNELDEQVRSTSLVLKKHWEDGNITNVSRVAVYVYQISWRDGVQIDKQLYKSVILSDILGWEVTVTDLPLNSKSDDGTEITYTYTVEEAPVEGYTASYDIDTAVGVTEGEILITNRTEADEPAYVLPETGGSGIWPPIICGASLMVFAMVYYLLLHWKRRRETPS